MTSPPYKIRNIKTSDRNRWEPLWHGYLQFYESTRTIDATDILWQRLLDPAHEFEARVAESDDAQLVGLVHFFPHAHTWYAEPVCYLNDLYVLPEIRGGGIGRKLIETVVAEAHQRQWAEVYWQTQSHDNLAARGLYDKITGGADGFISYSIDIESP